MSKQILEDYEGPAIRPAYDQARVRPAIVHLGIGAFHRAHQAVYLDDCLAIDPNWAIAGASLRRGDTHDALAPQDFLYTLAVRHDNDVRTRIIGSVAGILYAPPDNEPVIAAIAADDTRIVTLTVTEKAYCRNPATGDLDPEHGDIRADLEAIKGARSVPGLLVAALAQRRKRDLPPISIVSCDNLPANGTTLANVVSQFAAMVDPGLADWIEQNIAFPCTMVDRIVPGTTDEDRADISALTGYEDAWPVVTEPFSQWVVEDRFAAGRPPLEQVGVIMADNVEPYEIMKLRLLNGSHSALAYLGVAAGHETVADAVSDPVLAAYLDAMMRIEIMPTVDVPGADLNDYVKSLLERFSNTALKHKTLQIAMDGSQKIPQRLLGTIRDRKTAGAPHDRLTLAVAAWIRHLSGSRPDGSDYSIEDPMAGSLAAIAGETLPDIDAFGNSVLDLQTIFGEDLTADRPFRAAVLSNLRALFENGAGAAMKGLC
ncbi:MAG: mannitol dehydrogenase family protein [Hyphomicrobiales bacterium]|nr:mannitol dehydrogenase family protein [Hyphomicrobiales bacterium]MCP5001508.1 mannitol dehydrogenase family protein [Hyphomicrobiales bacterium]